MQAGTGEEKDKTVYQPELCVPLCEMQLFILYLVISLSLSLPQESMIEVAKNIIEPKRKGVTVKDMLQESRTLTQRIRFLVEEVIVPLSICVCVYV